MAGLTPSPGGKEMTKHLLLLTCAVGALSGGVGVGAAAAADTSSPSATEVGAVIVTAEKRQQNLQKVPIAVTAFTTKQRDLVGIENLQDMTNFTPGLVYSSVLDRVTLRGVGRQTNLLSADAAVTTYVDGFFTTSAVEASKPPMFVSNIEVLRGPQGTLQGRNAIGGALLVTTAHPSSTPHAEGRVTVGNYGYSDIEAYVTGPIADGLNFRVAACKATRPTRPRAISRTSPAVRQKATSWTSGTSNPRSAPSWVTTLTST